MIQHNVEPKYLEAHIVSKIVRMDRRNRITQGRVASDDCLDKNIIDLALKLIHIVALLSDFLKD
jgi:hypothetical protein